MFRPLHLIRTNFIQIRVGFGGQIFDSVTCFITEAYICTPENMSSVSAATGSVQVAPSLRQAWTLVPSASGESLSVAAALVACFVLLEANSYGEKKLVFFSMYSKAVAQAGKNEDQ